MDGGIRSLQRRTHPPASSRRPTGYPAHRGPDTLVSPDRALRTNRRHPLNRIEPPLAPAGGCRPGRITRTAVGLLALFAVPALAQGPDAAAITADPLQPIVVTGSRSAADRWQGTALVDVIDGSELREGQLQINLSEGLRRVPGLVIRNRENYAQDLQVSVRGHGARSTFGVRGVRLFVDGIPASAPDGQGQAANFPLGGADRIDVVRGPFAALYGASSGGAILLTTADGTRPGEWRAGGAVGSDRLWRLSTQATGQTGTADERGWSYALDLSRFVTDGIRPQSAADRTTANVKLSRPHDGGRTILVFNRQTSFAQDPLGLSRAEFDAGSAGDALTTPTAIQFKTRKSVSQGQLGLAWSQALGGGQGLELMGYGGDRRVIQYQAIPVGAQTPAGSSGGVIDLDRVYWGWNARWRLDRQTDDGRMTISAGLASDHQTDERKGYENFVGPTLGVLGRLRRDEVNRATTLDPYLQAEWRARDWTATAGLRHTRTAFSSRDRYVSAGNGDDSGETRYSATLPVVGGRLALAPGLQGFASVGRGFETPTLNEIAYRSGLSGFNTRLAAARSTSAEVGLRGRGRGGNWTATLFDIRTSNEIVVLTNSGGRATFQNAGRTRRQGLELAGELGLGDVVLSSAYTYLDARYRDGFTTCTASPCTAPNVAVPDGNRMPGLPRQQLFAQVAWAPKRMHGSVFTVEARHIGDVAVNDTNSDFADRHTLVSLGARFEQTVGRWTVREFVRVDNLTDRRHAGSVIVNDGNARFFEPGAGRSVFAGVEVSRRF